MYCTHEKPICYHWQTQGGDMLQACILLKVKILSCWHTHTHFGKYSPAEILDLPLHYYIFLEKISAQGKVNLTNILHWWAQIFWHFSLKNHHIQCSKKFWILASFVMVGVEFDFLKIGNIFRKQKPCTVRSPMCWILINGHFNSLNLENSVKFSHWKSRSRVQLFKKSPKNQYWVG